MLAGLIAPRFRLDYALASISCEHCRSSSNYPHYAPRHIIYYSDGAGSQYKNKINLVILISHEREFKIKDECIFFATLHGKASCDGIGGIVERYNFDPVYKKKISQRRNSFMNGQKVVSQNRF